MAKKNTIENTAKYKVGDTVNYHIADGETYVHTGTISEVINTRVDGEWGYLYKIAGYNSLWLKEKDII